MGEPIFSWMRAARPRENGENRSSFTREEFGVRLAFTEKAKTYRLGSDEFGICPQEFAVKGETSGFGKLMGLVAWISKGTM